jgi:hypothetical protein
LKGGARPRTLSDVRKGQRISFYLPVEQVGEMRERASAAERSLSGELRLAIRAHLGNSNGNSNGTVASGAAAKSADAGPSASG